MQFKNKTVIRITLMIIASAVFLSGIAKAFTLTSSVDTVAVPGSTTITWLLTLGAGESFKDFHVMTDDANAAHFTNASLPAGWNFSVTSSGGNIGWINFYCSTARTGATTFSVVYSGNLHVSARPPWAVTSDGNDNPMDGVIASGAGACAPSVSRVPSLTHLGLLLLLAIIIISGIVIMRRKEKVATI